MMEGPNGPGPFEDEDDEGEEDEDDVELEEPLLVIKCRLMVEKKPCSCHGVCVKKNEGTLEMELCEHFMIVDATEEETIEYDSMENN